MSPKPCYRNHCLPIAARGEFLGTNILATYMVNSSRSLRKMITTAAAALAGHGGFLQLIAADAHVQRCSAVDRFEAGLCQRSLKT